MAVVVTPQRVLDTAALARLELAPEELAPLASQLQKILDFIAELEELDTSSVAPTSHVLPLACPLGADEPRPGLPRDEVLDQAPETEQGAFVVPKFVEE